MSGAGPLVSIIINNYNYGRFLGASIDSALGQEYANSEVVVVDDGSTDDSCSIIEAYGDRIVILKKSNGGQASALNAGFSLSHGEIICFLDADDTLLPNAAVRFVEAMTLERASKVHWPMFEVDGNGVRTGRLIPWRPLGEGELLEAVLHLGPHAYISSPTSGNAWSRQFLKAVLPLPEERAYWPDTSLSMLAPFFGPTARIAEPQGCYRIHGSNLFYCLPWADQSHLLWEEYDYHCELLEAHARSRGLNVDRNDWKANSPFYEWVGRRHTAADQLAALIPEGESFILFDNDVWGAGEVLAGRRHVRVPSRDGPEAVGVPDWQSILSDIERLRGEGAAFLVFGWPAFPWIEARFELREALESRFRRIVSGDCLLAFDLRYTEREADLQREHEHSTGLAAHIEAIQ